MKNLNKYITEVWSGVKKHASIDIEAIESWCEEVGIENYTINDKGEIDVDGHVNLDDKNFKELPYKFGKVNGYFDIDRCKKLISLKNCPSYVGSYFSCSFCIKLNSLEGCPIEVGKNFFSNGCSQLDSLEGCPKKVMGSFFCKDCKRKFTKEEVESLCKVKKSIVL